MAHLRIPGSSGDGATIADSAAMDETGIVDVRVDVALDDWTAAGNQTLMARYGSSLNQRAWHFQVIPSGVLRMEWLDGSQALATENSSAAPTVVDGDRLQVRCLLNATAQTCDFYTRDPDLGLALSDDTNWSALGTQQATTATTIQSLTTAQQISFGAEGNTLNTAFAAGDYYGGYFKKGGTTEVVDVDFSDVSTWVFS